MKYPNVSFVILKLINKEDKDFLIMSSIRKSHDFMSNCYEDEDKYIENLKDPGNYLVAIMNTYDISYIFGFDGHYKCKMVEACRSSPEQFESVYVFDRIRFPTIRNICVFIYNFFISLIWHSILIISFNNNDRNSNRHDYVQNLKKARCLRKIELDIHKDRYLGFY